MVTFSQAQVFAISLYFSKHLQRGEKFDVASFQLFLSSTVKKVRYA